MHQDAQMNDPFEMQNERAGEDAFVNGVSLEVMKMMDDDLLNVGAGGVRGEGNAVVV